MPAHSNSRDAIASGAADRSTVATRTLWPNIFMSEIIVRLCVQKQTIDCALIPRAEVL
jgi:hypothetical protein